MFNTIDLINPVKVEVKSKDNVNSITFEENGSGTCLDMSNLNYNELCQKMFPEGLIPDDYDMKVAMLIKLIEKVGPVYDDDNPEWFISGIEKNEQEDRLYCKFKEEKR